MGKIDIMDHLEHLVRVASIPGCSIWLCQVKPVLRSASAGAPGANADATAALHQGDDGPTLFDHA